MPRPKKELDQHKEWLIERVTSGTSHLQVTKDLEAEHGVTCSVPTLNRKLAEWKIKTKRDKFQDSEELRARVTYWFREKLLTDEETYKKLEEEGFSISKAQLANLRRSMGLKKKCSTADNEVAEGAIAKALLQEIKNGGIEQMGRSKLYQYLRAKYGVVGRDRIYKIANLFDPEGPKRRKAENGRNSAKRRAAARASSTAESTTIHAATTILQEPQMPLPSYPPPPIHMPLHYGI